MDFIPDDEEEEVIVDLPTLQMADPLLPEDYPLFNWDDWPNSRAALVPGGPTKYFEKACWNAIIDTFSEAISAAGLPFYREEEGITPEHLKITKGKYGRLLATVMNTTVDAIDDVVPMPWQWSYDAQYRGFLKGYRDSFRGSSWTNRYPEENLPADVVYPEYILDLVRRINMIIEFMRGTYPYTQEFQSSLKTNSLLIPGLRAGRGVPVSFRHLSPLLISEAPAVAGIGKPFRVLQDSNLNFNIQPQTAPAGVLSIPIYRMGMPIKADGEVRRSNPIITKGVVSHSKILPLIESIIPADLSSKVIAFTNGQAGLNILPMLDMSGQYRTNVITSASIDELPPLDFSATTLQLTEQTAVAEQLQSVNFEAAGHISSRSKVIMASVEPLDTESVLTSHSHAQAEASVGIMVDTGGTHNSQLTYDSRLLSREALAITSDNRSKMSAGTRIITSISRPAWSESKITTEAHTDLHLVEPRNISVDRKSGTVGMCSLGTAWEPPIWHEDGLWIRQVRTAKRKTDGSLDFSGSGDPIGALRNSSTTVVAILDTAWLPPEWVNGGLYLRQVRMAKVLEDGSLDMTVSGDELLPRQKSGTRISCVLDTAWNPPIMVDGGLLIQQAQTVRHNENNELEVL